MFHLTHLDFDIGEAVFLTYTGLSAAFIALALLIVFIMLVRWFEHWRGLRINGGTTESVIIDPDFISIDGSSDSSSGARRLSKFMAETSSL